MNDMDRFEARLAASLERLAAEAPTDVEAHELALTVADSAARRAWRLPAFWGRGLPRAPTALVAFVTLAVPVLALGVLALNLQRGSESVSWVLQGHLVCSGSPWTTAPSSTTLDLDCTSEASDPRLAGSVRITLGQAAQAADFASRTGQIELRSDAATWAGQLSLLIGPNGLASGDALLTGSGPADGDALRLHLISTDGLSWGVFGSITAPG